MGKAIIIKGADFSQVAVASNTIPVTGLAITGASGSQTQRQVQLSVSYTPADTTQLGVVWSVISGNATITSDGLLTYNGSTASASVVVKATSSKNSSVYAQATVSFALPAIEAPMFSPAQGTYSQAQSVALSCGTAGATIYYTTDGSTPTTSSSVYSSPIAVAASMTIKAIAVKNGLSSEVATASYVIAIPHTVTVSVTDYAGAVSDATVVMTDSNNVDHSPQSVSSGAYEFILDDGNYTLSVVKSGYVSISQSVTVGGGSSSTSVALKRNLAAKAFVCNANCMGTTHAPLYPVLNAQISGSSPTLGAYIQAFTGGTRCGIAIQREDAANPVVWNHWAGAASNLEKDAATIAAKEYCSLIEWPSDCQAFRIRITNSNYYVSAGVCSTQQTDIDKFSGSDWVQGGSGFDFTLNRSNHQDACYIGVWMKYQASSQWNNNTTIESLGLTIEEV